jgi:hypothetical protein
MKNLMALLYLFSLLSLGTSAQEVQSSKTYIQTCYNDKQCFSLNSSSFIFYNPDNHELLISVDFNKFKLGNDTLDEWLYDLDDTKLVFRGQLNTDNLLTLTHHNSKAIIVNGLMSFNGVSHTHSIELTLFEIPREGILFNDNQNNYFDRINANLQFGFYPKEFKLNKKQHHLKKKITLAIYRGYVNPYRSNTENFLKD